MSRRRRNPRQPKKSRQAGITRMQIGLVVGLAIIMVLVFIVFNQGFGGQAPAQTASSAPPPPEQGMFAGIDLSTIASGLTDDHESVLGAADAPVTIVDYSDYQCPHCATFARETLPEIMQNYVAAGQVRYVHGDMAILGPESQWAAEAAHCAAEQGRFWEYHELLFQKQSGRNEGTFSSDNLKKFAAELGLDTPAFNQCIDQTRYAEKVKSGTEAGKQLGVKGTPSFFINGEFVEGNKSFAEMQQIIDRKLQGSS